MSNSRRAVLLAAACSIGLVTGLVSVAFPSTVMAETLTDALALAYQTNPTLQAQRANQRAADEGVVQAKTAFRPALSASADVSGQRTELANPGTTATFVNGAMVNVPNRDNRTINTSSAGLSLAQPLYSGGRATANLTAAQADVLAGREDLRSVEQSVLGNVIQSYVDVRRDQERLRIANENVAVLSRQLEESDARFEVGEITRTDVAQSQARLAAARASQSSAQAILAASRAAYAAVVGQNPTDLAPEPSLAALLPTSVEQAFDSIDQFNPQVQAARYAEQAAAARVAVARSAYRPTVSARAGLGWDAQNLNGAGSQFGDYGRALTGSITASVPLFTGGLNGSQVRAATERENAARIAVEGAKRSALQQVSTAWNNLLASRSNLVSNEEQVRATRIAFEGVRQEQQVGLRTTLDVLNAQLELANAEVSLVVARRDEYVASASVLQAMGVLNLANLAPAVERYDPVKSYDKVNHAFGWVPWEPVIQAIDHVGAPSTAVKAQPKTASK
ncbi:TolC family outer membrane protein [Caulobacter sp. DWR2-3-1b2]|uniref:TolC family outer membrane protein n=1 Tax=unclassified Caulobacter TaxID=2648921 RepID=UPI003CEA5A22